MKKVAKDEKDVRATTTVEDGVGILSILSFIYSTLNFYLRFKKARVIAPLHTNGPVAFTRDGTRLFTCVGEQVLLTDVSSGAQICRFKGVSRAVGRS